MQVITKAFHPPDNVQTFAWGMQGGHEYDLQLLPGAYAVVQCVGEELRRALRTDPAELGHAGGGSPQVRNDPDTGVEEAQAGQA